MLFAASVEWRKTGPNLGTPHPLFRPPILEFPWDRYSFDLDKNGDKFVVNTVPVNDYSSFVLVAEQPK